MKRSFPYQVSVNITDTSSPLCNHSWKKVGELQHGAARHRFGTVGNCDWRTLPCDGRRCQPRRRGIESVAMTKEENRSLASGWHHHRNSRTFLSLSVLTIQSQTSGSKRRKAPKFVMGWAPPPTCTFAGTVSTNQWKYNTLLRKLREFQLRVQRLERENQQVYGRMVETQWAVEELLPWCASETQMRSGDWMVGNFRPATRQRHGLHGSKHRVVTNKVSSGHVEQKNRGLDKINARLPPQADEATFVSGSRVYLFHRHPDRKRKTYVVSFFTHRPNKKASELDGLADTRVHPSPGLDRVAHSFAP